MNNKFLVILFITLFVLKFVSEKVNAADNNIKEFKPMKYKNCKSKFEILGVDAIGCGNEDICVFIVDSKPKIRIGFKPDRNVSELKTSIWANLGGSGALTKFHLKNDNSCQGNNFTCPIEQGKIYYYSQTVDIIKEYANANVQVNWVITNKADIDKKNNNNNKAPTSRDICIKFRAVVKNN